MSRLMICTPYPVMFSW